jgi:hypothetical protein
MSSVHYGVQHIGYAHPVSEIEKYAENHNKTYDSGRHLLIKLS